MPLSPATARVLHVRLLATALVVKGLWWPAAPPPIALSLVACGLVALSGRRIRVAFGVASGLVWLTIATDSYSSNHFFLLGLLTAYAVIMDPDPRSRWGLGELLTMVQVSTVYFWAGIWKVNSEFLSGSVLLHEWDRSWVLGPSGAPQWLAVVLAVATIAGELTLAGLLWFRRLVVPWAVGLAAVLHLGMILTIGAVTHTTAELVAFALACASSFGLFIARPGPTDGSSSTPPGRPRQGATSAPAATPATPA